MLLLCATRGASLTGRTSSWGPIDKHSTGGVGDLVSRSGPLLAACGGYVYDFRAGPRPYGRDLDKLDAIPGYIRIRKFLFQRVVAETGVAIIDRLIFLLQPMDDLAIRDTTATVESIGLITASILSKKLAAGLDALVMDVKVGNGAFMATTEQSRALARSISEVATAAGTPTSALLTDMNQSLASSAGNAIEVREAIDFLTGNERNKRLEEVTLALCSEVLQPGLAVSASEASKYSNRSDPGRQLAEMVCSCWEALRTSSTALHTTFRLLRSKEVLPLMMDSSLPFDTRELGLVVREREEAGASQTRPLTPG